MKLQYRILLAQLPAILVILLLLLWGSRTVDRLGAESDRILAENYRSVLAAERMKESIERLDSAALLRAAGSTGHPDAALTAHRAQFEAELQVEESNITEPGEREGAARLREAWTAYEAAYATFLEAPADATRTMYLERMLPAFQAVHAGTDKVLALNHDAMLRKSDEARASADAAQRTWLAWSALGLLSAVGLGITVAHRLSEPLRTLSQSAEQVGEGHLDIQLPHTRVEELDALADAFNTMATRLRLYRRASDSDLSRARESAQAAIESLADPVLVLTLRGELRATNGAARRLLGVAAREKRLDGCDTRIVGAVERAHAQVVGGGLAVNPSDFSAAVVIDHPDGERALLPHATPINDTVTGELVGVTVLLQDVTRLRRLDELKGNLVQTVAHELRTPLTSLGMALHLALDERVSGPLEPKLLELLVTANEDVVRLRGLVEDLLDLSRIQEGRIALRREMVAPAVLLAEARESSRLAAEAAGIELEIDAPPEVEPVSVDRARMHLALSNLVSNAVRHAPKGTAVTLRARALEGAVRFEVDDAGPGVPVEDRERIFEAFVRGSAEEGPGAGLGLYIAREVARAHGGRIGVTDPDSHPGGRFWVEIPR